MRALELGAVETLICWENLDIQRYVLKNHATTATVLHLTPEQEKDKSHFTDKEVNTSVVWTYNLSTTMFKFFFLFQMSCMFVIISRLQEHTYTDKHTHKSY